VRETQVGKGGKGWHGWVELSRTITSRTLTYPNAKKSVVDNCQCVPEVEQSNTFFRPLLEVY